MDNQISWILNNVGLYREALNLQEQIVLVDSVLNKVQYFRVIAYFIPTKFEKEIIIK